MLVSCESAAYHLPWEDVQKVTTAAGGEGQGFEGELKWEKEREVLKNPHYSKGGP